MTKRITDYKMDDFILRAKKTHRNEALLKAWYRGLPKLKRNLTPNDVLLKEYPNAN